MRYSTTRKLNLSRFFPTMQFENKDFCVEDASSPQEADEAVDKWVAEWLKEKGWKEPKKQKDPFAFQKSVDSKLK